MICLNSIKTHLFWRAAPKGTTALLSTGYQSRLPLVDENIIPEALVPISADSEYDCGSWRDLGPLCLGLNLRWETRTFYNGRANRV